MNVMMRLLVVSGFVAAVVLILALGLAQNHAALMGPAHLILFAVAVAVYLVPSALAVHRNCLSTPWIITLNVVLGWTIFGWFAAIGWAAGGKTRTVSPAVAPPPNHPLPTH